MNFRLVAVLGLILASAAAARAAVPNKPALPALPEIDFPPNLKTAKQFMDYSIQYYKARNISFGPAPGSALAANGKAEGCGGCDGKSRRQRYPITTNGCTMSPDYYFKSVCNRHDICYGVLISKSEWIDGAHDLRFSYCHQGPVALRSQTAIPPFIGTCIAYAAAELFLQARKISATTRPISTTTPSA